ncbi:MAG: hypothetical protein J1E62_02770 [Lachnospiraceae bacterium]|nr:hypothetical protein [Lachnospiraceae bacterium]
MNIRDVVTQEQNQTLGKDAHLAAYSRAGQKNLHEQGVFLKATGKAAANFRNMEVPVTPTQQFREEGSGNYTGQQTAELIADGVQAQKDAGQNLAILTGEDYKQLEEDESALEKYQESSLERAVERIRAERQWKSERLEENLELRRQLQEDLEQIQAGGFLSQKSEAQIREALKEANLPATQELVDKVVGALQMGREAEGITDAAKVYIVGNGLPASIETIYHGMHSGGEGISTDMLSDEDWERYALQIENILSELGATDAESLEYAKWLFANELPITEETLARVKELDQLTGGTALEQILYKIVDTLAQGKRAEDTILGDKSLQEARELIQQIAQIEEADVRQAIEGKQSTDSGSDSAAQDRRGSQDIAVTLQEILDARENREGASEDGNVSVAAQEKAAMTGAGAPGQGANVAAGMTEAQLQEITAWRQLEEIRLHMTMSSVLTMRAQGITIETQSLEELIGKLRQIEEQYYTSQAADAGQEVKPEHISLMQESITAVREIAQAPAQILGASLRQHELMTVQELHSAAVSATRSAWQYQQDYEAVGTQVRPDLGDNVKKAFANIPEMLKEMNLEDTRANERAIRILGYNQMEITEDNIQEMKQWDAQVNRLIEQMKPSVVLDMIRRGENPLESTVPVLNETLAENDRNPDAEQERFSRYLWQLEKSNQITEEEKQSYIGIYRLLNQIEKSDGAAIGAVIQSGREMTLGNLLTAVRTRKGHGIDAKVDDENGERVTAREGNSITRQIETAYYQNKASEALQSLTPAKVQELTGGNTEELLAHSLERVAEELQDAEGNPALLEDYYEEQAEDLRETLANADAAKEFLAEAGLPDSLENIRAAEKMLDDGSVVKELYNRRQTLSEERQEELEELLEEIPESVEDREQLMENCQKAEQFMEEILLKSSNRADITYSERRELKGLGQLLKLQQSLTRSQTYEIPIKTGDTITRMNLTIRENTQDVGKVQVSIQEPIRISMDFSIQEGQVKGLVLCDERAGFEALQSDSEALQNALTQIGCTVKNISYGMDFRMQNDVGNRDESPEQTDTKLLYQAAKVMVSYISNAVNKMEE